MRVESERVKCLLLAGNGGHGRGPVINVTPTVEPDPVPLMEEEHTRLMEVAQKLVGEVFTVASPQSDAANCTNTESS